MTAPVSHAIRSSETTIDISSLSSKSRASAPDEQVMRFASKIYTRLESRFPKEDEPCSRRKAGDDTCRILVIEE